MEFTQFRLRVMPVGTCELRYSHSETLELDHKADFGDIPAQVIGVKMGPCLVKTSLSGGSGRSGPGTVPGEACAWAWLHLFFCGLCLILSNTLQLSNRSSHTNQRKQVGI